MENDLSLKNISNRINYLYGLIGLRKKETLFNFNV